MFREIINFYENKGCQVLLIIELEATVPLDVGLINETLIVSPDKKKLHKVSFFFFSRTHCLASSKNLLLVSIYQQKRS